MVKKSTTYKGAPKPYGKSGHFNESRRHSLQAKGIKTGNLSKGLPVEGFAEHYTFFNPEGKDIITVWMRPEEFLRHTYEEYVTANKKRYPNKKLDTFEEYKDDVLLPKHVQKVKGFIKKDGVNVPFLEFDRWGRPISHEGRHTAMASIELGLEYIPVTLSRKRYVRDWETPPTMEQKKYFEPIDFDKYKKYPEQPRAIKIYEPKRDTDGDGVPDMEDCEPLNPEKQGLLHEAKVQTARLGWWVGFMASPDMTVVSEKQWMDKLKRFPYSGDKDKDGVPDYFDLDD